MTQHPISLPFRNIRDVIGLHAKVASSKTFLVRYDDAQQFMHQDANQQNTSIVA